MPISAMEIYPYGKNSSVKLKSMVLDDIKLNTSTFDYAYEKYLTIFNDEVDIITVMEEVLIKLVDLTHSSCGYIGLVDDDKLRYYCTYQESEGKVTFQTADCGAFPITEHNLLTRSVLNKCIIISNDLKSDPRIVDPRMPHHDLTTYMGIPLSHGEQIIGQIGLSNASKYKRMTFEKILPIKRFFCHCLYLWKKRVADVKKDIALKKEIVTLKDSFIATMSHEIRTPLNGIVGMARLLSESTNLTDRQQKYIEILANCSTQLMELVNDILDFSKISSGGITLHAHPFNLKECIHKVVEVVSHRAVEKGLEIRVNLADNLPETINGDSRRISQVLFNLLTNAIKFTDNGFIELKASCMTEACEQNNPIQKTLRRLFVEVRDTGVGISKPDQEKLFEVFTKLIKDDNQYANTSPGAGLGLAISKFIVEAMGGSISVESDGKRGSTFKFNILFDDDTDILQLLKDHEQSLKNKTVLVIDDAEDNRIYLLDILFSWGMNAIPFGSGREALSYMERREDFDLAIIDLYMPNMSGIDLLQAMRERKYKQPTIGLSSVGSDINGKEWFDHFTTKPISKAHLFNVVLKCIKKGRSNANEPLDTDSCRQESGSMRIIVAEDDYYNQILITELLKNLGYNDVTVVDNGKACVEEIKKTCYRICLMDVKMPIMDGLEATRIIKKLKNHPTVIGVSASVLDSDRTRCYAAGMDGHISKPIQKDQLETVLKQFESYSST